jgi:hypothetical protein
MRRRMSRVLEEPAPAADDQVPVEPEVAVRTVEMASEQQSAGGDAAETAEPADRR